MIQSSEYCAVGHPDRTCDAIASHILDQYLIQDPQSRVAVEVQLKDGFCTVSGEISSKCSFSEYELSKFVREAIAKVGYTPEYQKQWGKDNIASSDDVVTNFHLSQQSADIAQGVNANGWGDQGIFWGLAEKSPNTQNLPMDYYLARKIGIDLYDQRLGGIDIKTLVTTNDGKPIDCVVAIPLLPDADQKPIEDLIRSYIGNDCPLTINGTGRYVKHGPVGDCGTTGRKLVVDFYGGNSRIGGGCTWGKDPSKADVTLNIYARMKALAFMKDNGIDWVQCAISCCIGRPEIRITFYDRNNEQLHTTTESRIPSDIIEELGLRYPGYFDRCRYGMFGYENI